MINLFIFEIRKNMKTWIIWTIITAFIIAFYLSFYPSMFNSAMDDVANLKLDLLPSTVLAALNISKTIDFTNILQYTAMIFSYTIIAIGLYALFLGGNIFVKEEEHKTISFLASQPITRASITTVKILAAVVLFTIYCFVVGATIFICLNLFIQPPTTFADISNEAWKIIFGVFATGYVFLFIGLLLSAFFHKMNAGILMGIFFASYFLGAASRLNSGNEWMIYFSPSDYFNSTTILKNGIEAKFILLSIIIIVVCIIGTYIAYIKKDFKV